MVRGGTIPEQPARGVKRLCISSKKTTLNVSIQTGYPSLVMFKVLNCNPGVKLSDEDRELALHDRISFVRFMG